MGQRVLGHTPNDPNIARAQIAAEKLRNMKKTWRITWAEMGRVLGIPHSWKSLSVYASNGENYRLMPPDLAEIIIAFDDSVSPALDKPRRTGIKVVLLWDDDVLTLPFPDIGICAICGALFIVRGYGQKYCSHRCRLEARRMAYKSAATKKE